MGDNSGGSTSPGVVWCTDAYEAAADADAVVILTEWNEFRALDLTRLAGAMARPAMADLRNVYDPKTARAAGFAYAAIGRNNNTNKNKTNT